MMTVYGYGFKEPVVEAPEPQGPGMLTYALIAGVVYWAWAQGWFKSISKMGMSGSRSAETAGVGVGGDGR